MEWITQFITQLINGLNVGSVYALIALGYGRLLHSVYRNQFAEISTLPIHFGGHHRLYGAGRCGGENCL